MEPSRPATGLSAPDIETLLALTRALAAPFELRSLLTEIAAAAARALRAERASVWLLDAATGELTVEIARDLPPLRVPVGAGLVGRCAETRAPINVPDCYADPRFNPEVDRRTGFRTRCTLTVPLIDHRGELIGVMQAVNRSGGVFGPDDEPLALALAAQCAVALSRTRMTADLLAGERLKREAELAGEVQRSSLPARLPALPGYDLHAAFQPASDTGGDTYDLAPLPSGLLVVLADATGHGIGPALSVTQMHAMLRIAFRMGADLETAFHHVNDELARTLGDGRFVTAFVGVLDPARHRLRFVSGGQGPILHYRAAHGGCAVHRATSFPMGAMPLHNRPRALELTLEPGDWLVLLSDGVYEAADPAGELFGRERVEALVHEGRAGPAAALTDRLLDAVRAHTGPAPQDDDITTVLIRRLPAPAAPAS